MLIVRVAPAQNVNVTPECTVILRHSENRDLKPGLGYSFLSLEFGGGAMLASPSRVDLLRREIPAPICSCAKDLQDDKATAVSGEYMRG